MALFGGANAPALTPRLGGLVSAPGPLTLNGAPTPPAGASADASGAIASAQAAADRQRKLAQAASPLIGGSVLAPVSPAAKFQPKTLVGY